MVRFIKRLYKRLYKRYRRWRGVGQVPDLITSDRPFSPPRLQTCSCCSSNRRFDYSSDSYINGRPFSFNHTSSSYLHGRINTIIGAVSVEPPPAKVDGVYITRV